MNNEEFLKRVETELKISKNSPYTIRNYLLYNSSLLKFSGKSPEQITEEDVKYYIASNFSEKSSSSVILFLSAIKYSFLNIFKRDITSGIKRPKKETRIPAVLSREEVKKLINSCNNKKAD